MYESELHRGTNLLQIILQFCLSLWILLIDNIHSVVRVCYNAWVTSTMLSEYVWVCEIIQCFTFHKIIIQVLYREYFYCVDQVHGCALHSGQCATCHKAHTNFANESACLTADNIQNEVVTIHRSQEMLKLLSFLHIDIFHN
jgi:hypothetical protein